MIKKLGPFRGINNVDEEEALRQDELRSAVNVDVTDRGHLKRRPGFSVEQAGQYHSLWNDGRNGPFVCSGSNLLKVNADLTTTLVRSGLQTGRPVSYTSVADRVFYSNGDITGCLVSGEARPLGVEVPNPPSAAVQSNGALTAGTYSVRLTCVDAYDQEGGASRLVQVTVDGGQGIRLTLPEVTSSDTTGFIVYATPPNGDKLYAVADVELGTATVDLPSKSGATLLETEHLSPMPAGRVIGVRNGRLLIASGKSAWFSEALRYALTRYTRNYVSFETDVNDGIPVDGGWYISTADGTYFLAGDDIATAEVTKVHNSTAVTGTMRVVDASSIGDGETPGEVAIWYSGKGFLVGSAKGDVTELTRRKFSANTGVQGAAQLIQTAGLSKFVCAVKSPSDAAQNMAVGDRVTAEVRRNGVIIN